MQIAYQGLVSSVLDCGCIVLTDVPDIKTIKRDRIQYVVIRIGLIRTTSTNVLLDQTAEWPLFVRPQLQIRKFLTSASRFKNNEPIGLPDKWPDHRLDIEKRFSENVLAAR